MIGYTEAEGYLSAELRGFGDPEKSAIQGAGSAVSLFSACFQLVFSLFSACFCILACDSGALIAYGSLYIRALLTVVLIELSLKNNSFDQCAIS